MHTRHSLLVLIYLLKYVCVVSEDFTDPKYIGPLISTIEHSLDYEIVFPSFSHKQNRSKRELLKTKIKINNLYLEIKVNEDVIWWNPEIIGSSGEPIALPEEDHLCEYKIGQVLGFSESLVAVSQCGTQITGLIQVNKEKIYFVEPLTDEGLISTAHLLYMPNVGKNETNIRRKRESYLRPLDDPPTLETNNEFSEHFSTKDQEFFTVGNDSKQIFQDEDSLAGYFVDPLWQKSSKKSTPQKHNSGNFGSTNQNARWLELGFIIDKTVIEFHGRRRVKQYVLTLLNIVSAIYKDPSLDSNLKLILTRLIFYEERVNGKFFKGDTRKSLENINNWNERFVKGLKNQHDAAVWLTRGDLGGPSGYAPVGGVCDSSRQCALNRDEGLTSAFIIAHELAHVLGLSHDGDQTAGNDCGPPDPDVGSVMAPMVSATFHRFTWSTCARKEFHERVASWPCLSNEPHIGNATFLKAYIQTTFSMDEQCRMEFGNGYTLCRGLEAPDPCSHLWCSHESTPDMCKTKKGPPLEGTECGEGHWCIGGFCEEMETGKLALDPLTHNPRDGGWSSWSEWGPCSRTCDRGISFRSRKCDKPRSAYGGQECRGRSEEMQLCGEIKCPGSRKDTRAEQCARLPYILSLIPVLRQRSRDRQTWLPHEPEPETHKCQLICESADTGEIFMSGENLIDGTPCSYEIDSNLCIQGSCQQMACDGVFDSEVKEDACGICQGDNSTCRHVVHNIERPLKRVRTRIAIFPTDSRFISLEVRLWVPNNNNLTSDKQMMLFLRDKSGRTYNFTKNSDATRTTEQEEIKSTIIVHGGRFHFHRLAGRDSITVRGPLHEQIIVLLQVASFDSTFFQGSTYHIHNEFWISSSLLEDDSPQFGWILAGRGRCSKPCGDSGAYSREWICADLKSEQVAPRGKCLVSERPKDDVVLIPCNRFPCVFRWFPGDWETCSATCGSFGIQYREIFCVPESINASVCNAKVSPSFCDPSIKPAEKRSCNTIDCQEHWQPDEWSQCKAECGRKQGTQTRSFRCPVPRGLERLYSCGPYPEVEKRTCLMPDSRSDCKTKPKNKCRKRRKELNACSFIENKGLLARYCIVPGFRRLCCQECALLEQKLKTNDNLTFN